MWGTTLSMHIGDLRPTIEQVVGRGIVVKVLLAKPNGDAIKMAALRAAHQSKVDLETELKASLEKLKLMKGVIDNLNPDRGGRLELKTSDYLAPYALYAFDPDTDSGRIELALAALATGLDMRPRFVLEPPREGDWYHHFKDQFKLAWDRADTKLTAPDQANSP